MFLLLLVFILALDRLGLALGHHRLPFILVILLRYRGVFLLHDSSRRVLSFDLMGVSRLAHGHGTLHRISVLLHDVSQFMCDQLASDGTAGLVSAFTAKDVLSRRERSGAEC